MTIHLIRHAQSEFNALFKETRVDPMIFDSRLSKLGEEQARKAQKSIHELDISKVVVSPFIRTLQTASLLFGSTKPFEINVAVREQLSNSCDVGSSPRELTKAYPHLDFSHLEECWWHQGEKDHRGLSVELHAILQLRADGFVRYLHDNSIGSTAVVTHGNFIHALTDIHVDNCQIVEFDPAAYLASK